MTPKERAAMQQALGALVRAEAMYGQPNANIQTALREALAEQAEQEPVAWHHPQCEGQCIACLIEKAVQDAYGTQGRDYMLRHINAAPVRTKDLTDDEISDAIHGKGSPLRLHDYAIRDFRAVIAADREKNK